MNYRVESTDGLLLLPRISCARFRTQSCLPSSTLSPGIIRWDFPPIPLPQGLYSLSSSSTLYHPISTNLTQALYPRLGTMDRGVLLWLHGCRQHSPVLFDHGSFDHGCLDPILYTPQPSVLIQPKLWCYGDIRCTMSLQ